MADVQNPAGGTTRFIWEPVGCVYLVRNRNGRCDHFNDWWWPTRSLWIIWPSPDWGRHSSPTLTWSLRSLHAAVVLRVLMLLALLCSQELNPATSPESRVTSISVGGLVFTGCNLSGQTIIRQGAKTWALMPNLLRCCCIDVTLQIIVRHEVFEGPGMERNVGLSSYFSVFV